MSVLRQPTVIIAVITVTVVMVAGSFSIVMMLVAVRAPGLPVPVDPPCHPECYAENNDTRRHDEPGLHILGDHLVPVGERKQTKHPDDEAVRNNRGEAQQYRLHHGSPNRDDERRDHGF